MGCHFARYIAAKPKRYGQVLEVVRAKTAARIANSVERRIGRLVADPTVSAAVLLFPDVASLEELAKGLLGLKGRRGWQFSFGTLDHPTAGELVTVGISRSIPFGGAAMASEALVLGPYDVFPPTRRADIPALEIYVGQPRTLDPKTKEPATKANLAHMTLDLKTQGAFDNMWDKSVAGRLKSLGDVEDKRAKAKVAFVLPKDMADRVGAAP